ncbi:MAG: hypothetical protein A2722_02490 [Candidatus Doudnabacteria bacterium RIFCSPHIGHO2_01_FULL_50_11]|uniref:Uncharacterized protein n=1 Tax=Candidatus Doudnabacteria bacterium RIFCSPHIGHO2_01_FULL_50_11 TaxID=1817828 RepID=A0A1F5PFS7_9BACT|nr:MAG: hypothetical protein A2722_02490 [Candidatus Doudnabacteria bacterium RIFCSPHIGHO2_01_FULL_50_11]HLC45004.1 hypothetical protein [Patescibacteria group bacterium]
MTTSIGVLRLKYRYTILLLLSLILFFVVADTTFVRAVIDSLGEWGYVGAFISGIFFVSAFTFAPASFVLFNLALGRNMLIVAVFGGLGAVVGDYIIFRFMKDNVFSELHDIYVRLGGLRLTKILHRPYLRWMLPLVGAIIIASPLPDEVGIALLGLSTIKEWQFIIVSYVLNALGILVIISLAGAG